MLFQHFRTLLPNTKTAASRSPAVAAGYLLLVCVKQFTTTSASAIFSPMSNTFALGAGCYWGTEKFVVKDFQKKYPNSIKRAAVGFMSGNANAKQNPSYREVCSGSTGHVEVLDVELADPDKTFEPLVRFFFQFHDPTTKNRQGNDVGTQYASVIFCRDEKQAKIARRVKSELQQLVSDGKIPQYSGDTVETEIITTSNEFYPAHKEHQQYLEKVSWFVCCMSVIFVIFFLRCCGVLLVRRLYGFLNLIHPLLSFVRCALPDLCVVESVGLLQPFLPLQGMASRDEISRLVFSKLLFFDEIAPHRLTNAWMHTNEYIVHRLEGAPPLILKGRLKL